MSTSQTLTAPVIINPYPPHHGLSTMEVQMTLAVAVTLCVVGVLLVEQKTLRRLVESLLNISVPARRTL